MTISGPENEDSSLPEHAEIIGVEGLDVNGFLQYIKDLDSTQRQDVEDTTNAIGQTVAEIQDLDNHRAVLNERRIILLRNRNEATGTYDTHRNEVVIDKLHQLSPTLAERFTDDIYLIYAAWKSLGDDDIARNAYDRLKNLRNLLEGADIDNPKYLVMFSDVIGDSIVRRRYSLFAAFSKPLIATGGRINSSLSPKINTVVRSLAYGYIEVSTGTIRDISSGESIDENSRIVLAGLSREYPSDVKLRLFEDNVYGVFSKEELEDTGLLSVNDQLQTISVNNHTSVKKILDIWELRLSFGLPVNTDEVVKVKQAFTGRYLPSHILERLLEVEQIVKDANDDKIVMDNAHQ